MARSTIDFLWSDTGPKVPPSDSKVNLGWAAEIPPLEYQNWWQNRADELIGLIEKNGFMPWDTATIYSKGAWCLGSDEGSYKSLIVDNTANDPTISAAQWVSLEDLTTVPDATTEIKGKVELATVTETQLGIDQTLAVTPFGVAQAINSIVPDATTSVKGKSELATITETQVGSDATRVVTPAGLASVIATTIAKGLIQIATASETLLGTSEILAVTPKGIKDIYAPVASPEFTGNPVAPTQAFGDSSTKLATTAFVQASSDTWTKSPDEASAQAASAANPGKVYYTVA